ncbi:hypothetical protein Xinn_04159 [Xenorhabdus innexi]|uniref:Uncharacterized protein n=1 Tax=Xenorhabdus innexi TaxID=290109 RepID=A0A2G0MIQ4_9GAMM|nr:hypothetical protein Xinn_04159 [Xenorhabdus innexi]
MAVQPACQLPPEGQEIQRENRKGQDKDGVKFIRRKQHNQGDQNIQRHQNHRLHHRQGLAHRIEHRHAE